MGTESTNPLAKHFRQPQLHLKLPSQGRWYAAGSLELPVTGEIPVYAMTARDELLIKTPDALLNGSATTDVIESCCPAIKDAWKMPTVDLDAVLIAIRIATYGNRMEFTSVCPHCNSKNEHAVDLNVIAGQLTCPDFDTTLSVDGLEIFLQPETFAEFTRKSIKQYEEQRLLAVVSNNDMPENEKIKMFSEMFNNLVSATVDQVARSVAAIKTEDGVLVEDTATLTEFFNNCDRTVWDAVKNHLQSLSNHNVLRRIPVNCENEECLKEYEAPLVFELSSFFD